MLLKRMFFYSLSVLLILILFILGLTFWIGYKTAPYIYHDFQKLPYRSVGLVLGTSKYLRGGGINQFYDYRIKGAIELYRQKKISYLLLSGDNSEKNYNEPSTMKRDLIKANIPQESIILDYAGFRTFDSIIRAHKVFNTNDFTIITQEFHCERAIFIALSHDIKAQCFAVPTSQNLNFIHLRELFARVNAIIDIYILRKEPKFLGPLIPIIPN